MTRSQEKDIELCRYFYPCNPSGIEIDEYLAMSERGEGQRYGKMSTNPLIVGKTKRGLHMRLWEEGVMEGSVPYATIVDGLPRYVVDFMKKEMFRGMDTDVIEKIYEQAH